MGFRWSIRSYVLVTPKNIRKIPRTMLDNDFIADIVFAHELKRLDIVGEGFGGELLVREVFFGVKM